MESEINTDLSVEDVLVYSEKEAKYVELEGWLAPEANRIDYALRSTRDTNKLLTLIDELFKLSQEDKGLIVSQGILNSLAHSSFCRDVFKDYPEEYEEAISWLINKVDPEGNREWR